LRGGKFDRRIDQKRGKKRNLRGAGDAPGEARGNHCRCSNQADGARFSREAAEVEPRMAFLRRSRKNAPGDAQP
jgi:hypothetical protein